jgi:PKD repeat protein
MGKAIMNRKKIHSILVMGIMLLSIGLAITPHAAASDPFTVRGYVYVDDVITTPSQIVISFPEQDVTALIPGTEEGYYVIDVDEDIGETGSFYVTVGGSTYLAEETLTVVADTAVYKINLTINTSLGPVNEPPSKVTLTVSDAKDGKLSLSWTAATDDSSVDHYNIYWDQDGYTTPITTVGHPTTSYTHTGLTNGQTYTYQVSAVDDQGLEGEKSDPASGTPTASTSGGGGGGGSGGGGGGGTTTLSAPNADANGPYYGVVDEEITFDGSGSNDPDGTIESYDWDFDNDGEYDDGTGISPTYSWSTPGGYTIKLKVTDNDGKTDTDTATVTISKLDQPPSDPTIVEGPTEGSINTEYTYIVVSTDPDGDQIKYTFNWGDGTTETTEDYADSNTQVSKNHTWTNAKAYLLKVQAIDNSSKTSGWTSYPVFIGVNYEEQDDGTYLVDNETDGTWDSIFDPDTGEFTTYEEEPTDVEPDTDEPDNTLWYILGIVIIIILLLILLLAGRRKKDKEKPKK